MHQNHSHRSRRQLYSIFVHSKQRLTLPYLEVSIQSAWTVNISTNIPLFIQTSTSFSSSNLRSDDTGTCFVVEIQKSAYITRCSAFLPPESKLYTFMLVAKLIHLTPKTWSVYLCIHCPCSYVSREGYLIYAKALEQSRKGVNTTVESSSSSAKTATPWFDVCFGKLKKDDAKHHVLDISPCLKHQSI